MPNTWFDFKQFRVVQALSAMIVSTDACIQGAWTASVFAQKNIIGNILDIGTGTGLLGLMLAQSLPQAHLTAIEPDDAAALEAGQNFAAAAWSDRMQVVHCTLHAFKSNHRFDAMICNPPFFHRHLHAGDPARNMARHDISLDKAELAGNSASMAKEEALFSVMYPATEWESWVKAAADAGWHLQQQLHVVPRPGKAANRIIGIFEKKEAVYHSSVLYIRDADNEYTPGFRELLCDFYLFL